MPTYEYECDKCRRVFEVRQRISEPALTTCDACGGTVRRLLSSAPFILKGNGWYVTDYPSAARKKGMESEKSTPAPASSDKGGGDKASGADKSSSSSSSSNTTAASPSAAASSSKTETAG